MPVFRFNCGACKKSPVAKFAPTVAQALLKAGISCSKCGGKMVRTVKPPTTNVVERLDAPHMVRAVERPADAERLYKERAAKDHSKDDK
jgi:transcription elongation factor Elf1